MTDTYNNNIDPRIIQNDDAPITVAALDQEKPVANQNDSLANINQQIDASPLPIQEEEKPPFKPLSNEDNLDNVYIQTAQAQATQESLRELEELRERRRREREPKQQAQTQPASAPTNIPSSPSQQSATQRGTTVDIGDGASFVQGGPQDKVATDKKIRVTPWYKEGTWSELGSSLVDAASQLGVSDIANAGWAVGKDFLKGTIYEGGHAIDKATTIAAREFVTNLSELDKWYKDVMKIDTSKPSSITELIHSVTGGDKEKIDRFVNNPFDMMLESDKLNVEKMHPYKMTTVTGHIIQEGARAMIGFLPVLNSMKGVQALSYVPRYAKWLAAFGIGDYLTQPVGESGGKVTDPNVANAIEEFPVLRNFVTEYLKLKEGDTRGERKFKNFMANSVGSNIIADGLFHLVRVIGKGLRVKSEIDAAKELHGEFPDRMIIGDDPGPEGTTNKPFEVDVTTAERQLNEATGISPAAKPVFDDVFDQLKAAGRNGEEAKAAAAVYAARYQTRANRLGNDADPFQLYKEENVKISSVPDNAITDADRNLSARSFEETRGLNQDIEHRNDHFGPIEDKQALRGLLDRRAPIEEIEKNPVVVRAMEHQRNAPRGPEWEQITPEYKTTREFNFNGERVVGYEAAMPRLRAQAESYSKSGPVRQERRAVFVLGAPATGKSTITEPLADFLHAAVPDADDVKRVLPEYNEGFGSSVVHEESTFINAELLDQFVENGDNVIIQKIGFTSNGIKDVIADLQSKGYTVDLVHLGVEPHENYLRMISRFLKSGRLIEGNYFKSIGDRPFRTWQEVKDQINGRAAAYDNTNGLKLVEGDNGLDSEITRGTRGTRDSNATGNVATVQGAAGDVRTRGVEEAQRAATDAAGDAPRLKGLPDKPIQFGDEFYVPGPLSQVHKSAEEYMKSTGRPYTPIREFVNVDPTRAKRIADAFDEMKHDPSNPRVAASYAALARETVEQLKFIQSTGLKIEFIKPDMPDPYAASPRLAAKDVQENNHLWVFPTEGGFGSSKVELSQHPMLQDAGIEIDGRRLVVNDAFRVVHDYFGHFKDGVGFRASGEENAWRSHAAMYSDEAIPAMTTETRGQNSWVNYGPHGDKNRTASAADTVYAPQKIGLLPDWVYTEGRVDPSRVFEQRAQPFYSAVDKAIKASKQTVATGQQWLSTLKQAAGVKAEELEWTGLSKFLKENNGKITKDELDAFFRDNQVELVEVTKGNVKQQRTPEQEARFKELDHTMGDRELTPEELAEHKNLRFIGDYDPSVTPPKFAHGNLVLPGGENQREFLITLPKKDQSGSKLPKRVTNQLWENGELISQGDETAVARWRNANPNADIRRVEVEDLRGDRSNSPDFYYRNHWDEPNVLAHIRVNERMINGKRTLFIEEIQSDWHQAGREQGYKGIGYRVGDKEFPSQAKASEYFKSIEPFIVGDRTFKTRAEASEFLNQSPVKVGDQEFATKNEAREFIKGLPEDQRKATKIEEPKIEEIKIEEFKKEPIDVAAVERIANVAWQKFDYAMKDVPNQIKINGEPLAVTSDRVIARLDVNDESYLSQLPENVVALARDFRDKWKAYEQASRDANKYSGSVPNAPFKKNWHELALKRAIKLAADEGFDQIAWTGGKIQNDRYNLANHIDGLDWRKNYDGTFDVSARVKGRDGSNQNFFSLNPEELKENFGDDVAKKIIDRSSEPKDFDRARYEQVETIVRGFERDAQFDGEHLLSTRRRLMENPEFAALDDEYRRLRQINSSIQTGSIEGIDLEVGGEGMRGFYDKMLVNTANDIAKPFGTKSEISQLDQGHFSKIEIDTDGKILSTYNAHGGLEDQIKIDLDDINYLQRLSKAVGSENARKIEEKIKSGTRDEDGLIVLDKDEIKNIQDIHVLPISDKLRKTAQEDGFKLFQPDGNEAAPGAVSQTPKGTITLNENDTIVRLFSTSDQSTFMHESGHLWLDEMKRDAALTDAPKQIKEDFDSILRWFGIDDANKIERSHHEQFARGFEEYLGTGRAPSPGLQGAFDRFKEWIVNIYKSLANVSNYDKITPEIREVMNRMLATDPEIAARNGKLFDEQGLTPEGMSFYGPRLQEHGYDSILVKGIIGPDGTPGKAVSIVPKQSAIERFPAVDFGVPEDVAARGISESAKEFANRAGVLRAVDAPDIPTTRAADGQEVFINLNRINTTDDVRQVLKDFADAFKPEIDEARRGVITHEQTRKLADEIGANETLDVLMQRGLGQVIDLEHTLAARNLLTTVGEEIYRLSEVVSKPTATLADKYNFMKVVSIHTSIQKQLLGSVAEAARILSAQRIMAKSRVEQARDIQYLIDNQGDKNIQNLAIAISDLKKNGTPPGGINLTVRRGLVTSGMDAIKENYIMGLLWSPSTHATNFAGNALTLSMSIADRFVAEKIAMLFGSRPGSVVDGEAAIMFHGAQMATWDAMKFAWKAMSTGESTITKGVNFLDTENSAITSRAVAREFGLSQGDTEAFASTAFGRFIDFVGKTVRMPGRLLAGTDEFFKTYAWRAELHAHALRQATSEGLEGSALLSRINQIVNDPPDHISLAASDFAAYVTMQSKLGSYGQKLMGIRQGNMGAFMLPIITFVKTPTNILRFTFEHSPIAPLVGQWQDDFVAGGARRELALAKMGTGTMIMAMAFDLAIQNKITGVGEHDQGKREARARTGELPSSFDMGDHFMSFQRLDPAAMIVSFAATVHRMATEADQSPEDFDEFTEMLAAAISVVTAGVLDKTYFQGVSQMVTAFRSADDGPRMFSEWAGKQYVANNWPAGTAFNSVRRFVDPNTREATNPWEYVMSKVAGWSHKLEPKLDLWGREIKEDEIYGMFNLLSPTRKSMKKDSPVDQEMIRLGIGQKGITWRETFRTMQGDPATINMTDFKKVRTKFIKLAGNELKDPANGLGAMDYLNAVISGKHPDSVEYQDMKTDGEEGGKAAWIKNTIARYRKMAREEIMNDRSPEMKEFVDYVYERAAIEKKRRKQYEMEPDIEQIRP